MWAVNFWRSQIGKKIVMAVTGLIGVGFVIGHMLGNLQMFQGPEAMNRYAQFLHDLGGLLWLARAVLLGAVILHVVAAVQLTRQKQAARPVGYVKGTQWAVSTFASRSIRWGGLLLLVFLVFHLAHFTWRVVFPGYSDTNIYGNVIAGFSKWYVSLFYIVTMGALFLHLYHGVWSSPRTLGAVRPSRNPLARRVAPLIAILVYLGFTAIPAAVLLGLLR